MDAQFETTEQVHTQEKKAFHFEYMQDPRQRELLALTVDQLVKRVHAQEIGTLIFLDKSARPLNTLFLDLWEKRFPESKRPDVQFMHVGKELMPTDAPEWDRSVRVHKDDPQYVEYMNSINSPAELEEKLGISTKNSEDFKDQMQYLQAAETRAREKGGVEKVMVIDEHTASGQSLMTTEAILRSLYPHLTVELESLSQQGDELFSTSTEDEYFAPWKVTSKKEDAYGLTGVIEPEHGRSPLIAESSHDEEFGFARENRREFLNKERRQAAAEAFAQEQELLAEVRLGLPKLIATLTHALNEIHQSPAVVEAPSEEVQSILEKATFIVEQLSSLASHLKDGEAHADFYEVFEVVQELIRDIPFMHKDPAVIEIHQKFVVPFAQNEVVNKMELATRVHKGRLKAGTAPSEFRNMGDYVTQLRQEMHRVADEYWENSERTNNS